MLQLFTHPPKQADEQLLQPTVQAVPQFIAHDVPQLPAQAVPQPWVQLEPHVPLHKPWHPTHVFAQLFKQEPLHVPLQLLLQPPVHTSVQLCWQVLVHDWTQLVVHAVKQFIAQLDKHSALHVLLQLILQPPAQLPVQLLQPCLQILLHAPLQPDPQPVAQAILHEL